MNPIINRIDEISSKKLWRSHSKYSMPYLWERENFNELAHFQYGYASLAMGFRRFLTIGDPNQLLRVSLVPTIRGCNVYAIRYEDNAIVADITGCYRKTLIFLAIYCSPIMKLLLVWLAASIRRWSYFSKLDVKYCCWSLWLLP